MKLIPNIGPKTRIGYVLFGVGLIALGWYALEAQRLFGPPGALVAIVAGGVVALEGIVGF